MAGCPHYQRFFREPAVISSVTAAVSRLPLAFSSGVLVYCYLALDIITSLHLLMEGGERRSGVLLQKL